jgi:hypothetical protein
MDLETLRAALYPHQRAAVEWMGRIESDGGAHDAALGISARTSVGILGEPPGAGKTRTVVALVAETLDSPPPNVPAKFTVSRSLGSLVQFTYRPPELEPEPCAATSVIVVSASLVAQWQRELAVSDATAAPFVVRLNRDVSALRKALDTAQQLRQPPPAVVLVCVRRYGAVAELMRAVDFRPRRVVVDEAYHVVCDSALTERISTAFTWLVSAMPETPNGLDVVFPRHKCYWSDVRMLSRAEMRLVLFRTPDADLVYPCEVRVTHHDCVLDSAVSYAARAGVSPEVQQMLDANDIAGAITLLGGAEGEDLMTVVRRRIALDLTATELELSSLALTQRRLDLLGVPAAAHQRTLECIERCEQRRARLVRDAENVESRFADALLNDCPICHDSLATPVLLTCCQSIFCAECVLRWLRASARCPSCRGEGFRAEKIATGAADAAAERAAPSPRRATKVEQSELIVAAAERGVLVYSSHTTGLAALENRLRDAGLQTAEVKGMSSSRDKTLASFARGQTKVLLLDATLNCAGIDLQHVSDIIIYHDMNERLKHQIIGRGRRINRTSPLNVHYLWRDQQ